jgi:cyclopropane-fatty-acyl-phospholipid synthase
MGSPPVRFLLWDDTEIREFDGEPVGTLRIREPRVIRDILLSPDLGFGEGYVDGSLEVEGDLPRIVEAVFRAGGSPPAVVKALQALRSWHPGSNTVRRARPRAQHHYDLGNDFYRLWLDERMVYTCAYFPDAETDLERAQEAKLEHVCRKLRLRPGERVVEAGCGWGALALHMARHHGVLVQAYNVSRPQVEWARQRAREAGLEDQVTFLDEDYRGVTGEYDAFVSVGMMEHVGRSHYRELGQVIRRSLRPGGRGLIHSIGRARPHPMSPWIERYIFPGSYIPSLREMLEPLEEQDMEVLDVENLRRHYARTLELWLERFEAVREEVERTHDAAFVRMWRLYLAASVASFRTGSCQLFQVLFAPAGEDSLPWTRDDIYATGAAGAPR